MYFIPADYNNEQSGLTKEIYIILNYILYTKIKVSSFVYRIKKFYYVKGVLESEAQNISILRKPP